MCASGFLGSKWGDLLYVTINAWVARLMTCARQLSGLVINLKRWVNACITHFIFRLRHLYLLPVTAFNRAANSSIIVELFEALSQVIWPIFDAIERGVRIIRQHHVKLDIHTLCKMPMHLHILNNAWPSRWPLCALLTCVKPRMVVLCSHWAGIVSSIQWPVTAK